MDTHQQETKELLTIEDFERVIVQNFKHPHQFNTYINIATQALFDITPASLHSEFETLYTQALKVNYNEDISKTLVGKDELSKFDSRYFLIERIKDFNIMCLVGDNIAYALQNYNIDWVIYERQAKCSLEMFNIFHKTLYLEHPFQNSWEEFIYELVKSSITYDSSTNFTLLLKNRFQMVHSRFITTFSNAYNKFSNDLENFDFSNIKNEPNRQKTYLYYLNQSQILYAIIKELASFKL
jgi:hypothetical protein